MRSCRLLRPSPWRSSLRCTIPPRTARSSTWRRLNLLRSRSNVWIAGFLILRRYAVKCSRGRSEGIRQRRPSSGSSHSLMPARSYTDTMKKYRNLNPRISISQTASEPGGQSQSATPLGSDNGQRSPGKLRRAVWMSLPARLHRWWRIVLYRRSMILLGQNQALEPRHQVKSQLPDQQPRPVGVVRAGSASWPAQNHFYVP